MESLPEHSPILVVDDDEGLLFSIRAALISDGLPEPALVSDSRRVRDMVRRHRFQLVLLDLIMPHLDGIEVLKQIKQLAPATEVIIVTAVDDVAMAVKAVRFGAYDYLVKPLNLKRTTLAIQHALERYQLKQGIRLYESPQNFVDLKHPSAFEAMVAEDEAMALVFHQAETCALSDYNILITGETGVGKGMLARIIHRLSHRKDGPFIAVNMPAFSHSLFEDNFFGHIRGAYTGAVSDKRGFFEAAQGGTLFLDEVTELAPAMQGKLLRVIEEKEFYRIGSTDIVSVDLRILSASNRNVHQAVASDQFRGDLYYRLNEYHIHIPPLRQRRDDIMALARYFLKIHAAKNRKPILGIAPDLELTLKDYAFPGNVRELENIIAAAVLVENDQELTLAAARGHFSAGATTDSPADRFPTLAEIQQRHIERAMGLTGGNRTRAARMLGIGLRTLQRKLKRYHQAPHVSK